ncbi:hypothetical protein CVT26_001085, partial [Gymnopilus dilepis]
GSNTIWVGNELDDGESKTCGCAPDGGGTEDCTLPHIFPPPYPRESLGNGEGKGDSLGIPWGIPRVYVRCFCKMLFRLSLSKSGSYTQGIPWAYPGRTLGVPWAFPGYTGDRTPMRLRMKSSHPLQFSTLNDTIIIKKWLIYPGYTLGIPWAYPGRTLGIPWVYW